MLKVNEHQKEILMRYLENGSDFIESGDLDSLLDVLDDKIMEIGFNDDYSLNEIGLKLQLLYDQIYNQN